MTSDINQQPSENTESKKTSGRILQDELTEALSALDRSAGRIFVSGLSAGLDIGLSLLLIAVFRTSAAGQLPPPIANLFLASLYSFGFIVVVLGRSELFTEQTTLAVLPLLTGQTSLRKVVRLWGIVYVSNLIGNACFAALIAWAAPRMGTIDPHVLEAIGKEVVAHPGGGIFFSGLLAGWMMGLLSWLVAAGRDTISQIVIVWLITAGIGLAHLHHSILGTVEVLAAIFSGRTTTFAEFGHFLFWVTLGNAVGGSIFVALIKYGQVRPDREAVAA